MRRTFAVVALTALAATALGACGPDPKNGGAGAASSSPPTVATAPAGTGGQSSAPEALRFDAPLVGGGSLDFRSLAGTTVALWFWAPT
ncbi:MAG: hypothetical protein RJA49_369 [Actinomycetota bacterium]|jgi:hypothetical protein